ncbi:EAL domain-containing protein [Thauera aromatica]|nr:EAL domain-containing protein [Thauera aromatica]MCK2126134.1 EAL domain-containing protein [Thauera aromatica]
MTLRRRFLMLLGAFALVSAAAGLWQLYDNRSKTAAAEWIHLTSQMAVTAQQISTHAAMERGLTAAILARPEKATQSMLAELERVRSLVDIRHQRLTTITTELALLAPEHPLFSALARVDKTREEMAHFRALTDAQLRGISNSLGTDQWIALMTRQIEELQELIVVGTLPLSGNIYTYAPAPVITDVLFTLAEQLGRERALISTAIARGVALDSATQYMLMEYRIVTNHARRRIEAMLQYLPDSPRLAAAQTAYWDNLKHYSEIRAEVYEQGVAERPYPVSAETWYAEATRAIDAVAELSSAMGAHFGRDVNDLHQQAERTLSLLAFIVCALALLFWQAVFTLRKRVLQPLKSLEQATTRISAGDLTQPMETGGADELGRLSQAFEHMRQTLLADLERREADALELRKLNTVIKHSASAVCITDPQGIIQYTNTCFVDITGHENGDALGRKAGFWTSGLNAQAQYHEMWETIQKGQVWQGELINRHKNGSLYWASVQITPVIDEKGEITHFIGVQHDISARRRIEDRLAFLASYDELTGLPNRNLLKEKFEQASAEAQRSGTCIALVSLGLGRFKQINDSLGRSAGDELLEKLSRRLSQCATERDVVARHGGAEFMLMFGGLDRAEDIQPILEHIVDILHVPVIVKGEKLQPSVAAGVSLLPADGNDFETLLHKAAIALHHAEAEGIPHCIYTDALNRDSQERLSMENALRLSLSRDELELHYQPKVDLGSGRMIAVEALARWRHPVTREYVSPARFIPIAEESGLIQQLGAWALSKACRQNKAWQEAGLRPIVVAVNLSAAQLRQPDLVETVAAALEGSGLSPDLLELELTESALMEDPDQANDTLARLKQLGLHLAIDDFGTGYSSLAYLSKFPVDQLKIDRSFVQDALSNPAAAAIASSVVGLAHQMGLKVVAEGVETEAQLAFLLRQGCDEMQGYYYSKPLPADVLASLLSSDPRLVRPDQGASRSLLIVDDEPAIHAALARALEDSGYQILAAHSARAALELLACHPVQVILSDEHMPDMNGIEFFARVKNLYPDTARIMLSDYVDATTLIRAINEGTIYKFIAKPWNDHELCVHIRDAFASRLRSATSLRLLQARQG